MSIALFDLGQRLRAAADARPLASSAFAPVVPPVDPVAVTITGAGDSALLRAADGLRQVAASGPEALAALNELGVTASSEWRTLVVADRVTLAHLLELAYAADSASEYADAAAVIGWWSQRADHPGTGAVLDVAVACSARWVLGEPPDHEREVAVWRRWLSVLDAGPRGLLELAASVSTGTTLPGLDALAEEDRVTWDSFVARMTDATSGWDWRRRDSRREAALGLASRCDVAELYESLRLGDPLVATRGSFGGTVVSGVITALPSRSIIEVTLDQLTCRLRERTAVEDSLAIPGICHPERCRPALPPAVNTTIGACIPGRA